MYLETIHKHGTRITARIYTHTGNMVFTAYQYPLYSEVKTRIKLDFERGRMHIALSAFGERYYSETYSLENGFRAALESAYSDVTFSAQVPYTPWSTFADFLDAIEF